MDEKGCRMCLHKSPVVLAKKGARRVHSRLKEHGENVTIVACGNALENLIPPMVIFKGVRENENWVDDLPPGSKVEMSQKGSMTTVLFCRWLEDFAAYKAPGMKFSKLISNRVNFSLPQTSIAV